MRCAAAAAAAAAAACKSGGSSEFGISASNMTQLVESSGQQKGLPSLRRCAMN
jgi:hypothetical protein